MTSTDDRDRRDFGHPPRARDLLNRHLHRIGTPRPEDGMAQLQIALLRHHLDLTHSALDDEGIDPEVTRRVLERIIYGAAPNPAETQERVRLYGEFGKLLRDAPPRIYLDGKRIDEQGNRR